MNHIFFVLFFNFIFSTHSMEMEVDYHHGSFEEEVLEKALTTNKNYTLAKFYINSGVKFSSSLIVKFNEYFYVCPEPQCSYFHQEIKSAIDFILDISKNDNAFININHFPKLLVSLVKYKYIDGLKLLVTLPHFNINMSEFSLNNCTISMLTAAANFIEGLELLLNIPGNDVNLINDQGFNIACIILNTSTNTTDKEKIFRLLIEKDARLDSVALFNDKSIIELIKDFNLEHISNIYINKIGAHNIYMSREDAKLNHLVHSTSILYECSICFGEYSSMIKNLADCGCKILYCLDCHKDIFESQLVQAKKIIPSCPSCRKEIVLSSLWANILIKDSQIWNMCEKVYKGKMKRKGFIKCLTTGCMGRSYKLDQPRWHKCIECKKDYLLASKDKIMNISDDYIKEQIELGNIKQCPGNGCQHAIMKTEGCDHMRCDKCGHEFNWKTLQQFKMLCPFKDCKAVNTLDSYNGKRLDKVKCIHCNKEFDWID